MNTRPDITHEVRDAIGRPILTVGALRALLADVDSDTHVVMDDHEGWYLNISHVIVPGADPESYISVELTGRGWTVYLCTGTTRARIATYAARYRALEHARHLAGTEPTDDD